MIVERIAEQVRQFPHAVAVTMDDQQLTYAQLWAAAGEQAQQLTRAGAGPGTHVGIALDRGLSLPVALLAVVRTGAAYVPFDRTYPRERLARMAHAASLSCIVSDDPELASWAPQVGVIPPWDALHHVAAVAGAQEPAPPARADAPLYLIFTSGSTGAPKGVVMGHGAIATLLAWQAAAGGLGDAARTLQYTPVSFDVHVQEFLGTWTTGGTLVMVDEATRRDPHRLFAFVHEQRIERLFLPFVALQQLAAAASNRTVPTQLRDVITAGEQLVVTPALRAFFSAMPHARLHNHYGPSETHVATAYTLPVAVAEWDALPPIGHAIDHTRTLLADDNGTALEGEAEGELWLGGDCVALGYVGDTAATGAAFVTRTDATGRWYRTGDVVRRDAQGLLHFVGRRDNQLKIRGHRVEPAEVELAIATVAGVRGSAVVPHRSASGDARLVAYVVPETTITSQDTPAAHDALELRVRSALADALPDYLQPSRIVLMPSFPLTPSGKLDRERLPAPGRARPVLATTFVAPLTHTQRTIAAVWQQLLELDDVGIDDSFFDLGGTSLLAATAAAKLTEQLQQEIAVTTLFERVTIRALADTLNATSSPRAVLKAAVHDEHEKDQVAVVGMALRVPGADTIEEFWHNVVNGVDSIRHFTAEELQAAGVPAERAAQSQFVAARGLFTHPESFDAEFFGYSARDAELMDPQHRVFLEACWHALEHAGHAPSKVSGAVGVWGGSSTGLHFNTYLHEHLAGELRASLADNGVPIMLGNANDYLTTRVSHKLGLRGPSIAVQTACSTSLVAIAHATQSLRSGECDVALAGGVSVLYPQVDGHDYQEGGIGSPDGHCRPFDTQAAGTVFGSGVGVVVLKRLRDAVADGDTIYAVVRGGAVNNDGSDKMSFAAPSVGGQAEVVSRAHVNAGVTPASVSYVECHGTATPIGDAIEVTALTQAFGGAAPDHEGAHCALGSVKSNVGHLIAAAGVTGFIKTVLALHHGELPPTAHFTAPGEKLALDASPFYVVKARQRWESTGPRRAGVSAFGFGGTNAHVVLEEAPASLNEAAVVNSSTASWHVLPVSAKTPSALRELCRRLAGVMAAPNAPALSAIAYTLQEGRECFAHRAAVVVHSHAHAVFALTACADGTDPESLLAQAGLQDDMPPAAHLAALRFIRNGDADWAALRDADETVRGGRRRVPLAAYPFSRTRYIVNERAQSSASAPTDLAAEPIVAATPEMGEARVARIAQRIRVALHELSGMPMSAMEGTQSFLGMGFDSLFLTQASVRLKKEFKVQLSFRQLFDTAPTIDALAAYIDGAMPADANMAVASTSVSVAPVSSTVATPSVAPAIAAAASLPVFTPTQATRTTGARFGPYKPVQQQLSGELTDSQRRYLAAFIERVQARTGASKAYAAANRAHLADPRVPAGFKQAWKEITYPIVASRSKGALVWDIDGNEYVDCVGGFGASFFGHAPDFVLDAVREQMEQSIDYGPQSPLAGPTAARICELTGHERAAFCNTGSEAVLAAMRMVRTVTGNDLIVSFAGSYHGMLDEVLVRPQVIDGVRTNTPVAPGIPASASANMVVLEYGDPASLAYIEQIADRLAGVLVEPVQSRNPELQPVEFVRQLRALTTRLDVPLIFDELITGFRLHPRGAQGWYGVDADVCTYGKVIGGGMPVGVVAGKARFLDALDGGPWEFGDASFPEAGVTYFAGTFVRHPAALAAVHAAVTRLTQEGPALQATLNARTAQFCEQVNREYRALGVPVQLAYVASVILPRYQGHADFESLYFQHLRYHGAHIWEGRPGFFTTAHTEAVLARLAHAFIAAARDMQEGGFFARAADRAPLLMPFSPAQSELWTAMAFSADAAAAYNEQVILAFHAELDADVLELALDAVINRHESLRSTVSPRGDGMLLHAQLRPGFVVHTLPNEVSPSSVAAHVGDDERYAQARVLAKQNLDTPFDLTGGPLVRGALIRVDDTTSWFCLAASHLVCDGWSMDIMMQDICSTYSAMRDGERTKRPTPVSLDEHRAQLHAERDEVRYRAAVAHWKHVYRQLPPAVELPLDAPRPPLRTFRGERRAVEIDAAVANAFRQFARDQRCTPFVATLAMFDLLLHHVSGANDLVVGVPLAGQPLTGLTTLVAHDVRFLAVRTPIDGAAPVAELLATVRRRFNEAVDHQLLSFGELVQQLRPARDVSRMPLVTAVFNLDTDMTPVRMDGARGCFVTTPRGLVKYDLYFNLIDHGAGQGFTLEVDHNADLYSARTVQQWIAQYIALLEHAPAHGVTRLQSLLAQVLTQQPSRMVPPSSASAQGKAFAVDGVLEGDPSPVSWALDTLVSRFEEAVDTHGDCIALTCGDESLTYAELDARVNQIAHWLRAEGVQHEEVIALHFERSLDMVVAMYGVLKAGAAYLPLDPETPAARTREVLAVAEPRMVLCRERDLAAMAGYAPASIAVRAIDGASAAWRQYSAARPSVLATPSSLAYVIFTSGSTGAPKGVMNEHGAIGNRLRWGQEQFALTPHDVVLQKTPYTFDVSVWEFFWPLQVGATLVLAAPGGHRDPAYLTRLIESARVTVAHFVPNMLGTFLAEPGVSALTSLRMVHCSGEALSTAHRDRCLSLLPNVALHNLYGPTEAAVEVSWWPCAADDRSNPVPIGRPVAGTRLYVLNDAGYPVPRGTSGELYIAGVQVARGYLRAPALTAERFVTVTVNGRTERAYRTGDMVRQRTDGALEFLGRNDGQVKVRGFRIELGDLEAKLLMVPGVQGAAALVVHISADDARLVAFVQPAAGVTLSQLKVRRELAALPPEYMLPQLITVLSALPLTSSGKVDRQALASLVNTAAPSVPTQRATTETEQRMLEIWRRALNVEQLSPDSYFFDVGGHSLLAIGVTRDMEAAFGRRFDLRDMLMSNLAQLAATIDASTRRVAG